MVGSAKDIADQLEQRFVERACDGFVVAATHIPGASEDFVRLVISELRRRGLHHREYEGLTLRENLGLGLRSRGYWNSWGGVAVSLPVSAKGRRRTAHQRAALLRAVENQTVPGEFLFRSFDGTVHASGEAEPPDPRKSQASRGKRP